MASMRDVVPYNRPNWTTPGPQPAAPSTALVPSSRPNFTMPGAAPQPRVDFDMGPGNANVPKPGMSREAQAFRAPPSAPAAPVTPTTTTTTTPEAGTPMQRAMRSMRSAAGTGKALSLAVLPTAAGVAANTAQRMIDDAQPAPAPFVPPAAKPGDIPTDPSVQAPAAIRSRPLGFGPDNEFTRNLANTFNAVSGLGAARGAGAAARLMREGSRAAQVTNGAAGTLRTAVPFVQGAQAAQALQPTLPAPNLTMSAAGADPSIGPPVLSPRRDGVIYREGNSYSGTGNIGFGAEIDNARNPGVGVTSLDFSEGRRQDAMELARMRAAAPQGPTTGGFAGGEQIGMARTGGTANFGPSLSVLGPSGNAMKPRDVRAANALAAERAIATERIAAEQRTAHMRESGEMARANLNAGVARENNAATIAATMRGQDITQQGNLISAAGQRARMQYDMAKDQRDYSRNVANDDFTQQSTAQADHNKWVESTFVTRDAEGKTVPDAQKIGDFNNAAQASIGALVAQLRQSNDPTAAAKAERLARRGLAGLDAEDRALLKALYDRRERHMQARGKSPFAGSGPLSNNLMDYALTGRTEGLVQNTVQMRGGQSIPENDLRYTEPANAILPDWFKTPTTALGPTPQEQRRMREGSQ